MTRSYHVTKRHVLKGFKEGSIEPIKEYALKQIIKEEHQRFKKVYKIIKSGKKSSKLRNSVLISAIKKTTKATKPKATANRLLGKAWKVL
jgi:hypothetical protein